MIELKNISKEFVDELGIRKILLKNISLEITDNKIVSIIAPTGAGKSTLLKIIAKLDKDFTGTVVTKLNSSVILIPSKLFSYPWLNVKENILFGIKRESQEKLKKILELVELDGYENHYPHNKSYGFRLRICLARALMRNPSLILLDEPFIKFDPCTRFDMYLLLKEIQKATNVVFLLATTNISEAVFLSDKIFLMKKNPGEIFKTMDVNFEKKNNLSDFYSTEFLKITDLIVNSFKSLDQINLLSVLYI